MNITTSQYKHCDLIAPEGRIDSGTAPQLAEAIDGMNSNGHFHIVIDFSNVSFISSAGLRVLINAQKTSKRYNRGEIVLCNVPENIRNALDLVGFTSLFKLFPDTLTAVGSF
jgi:anti-sigma B factor antagonist